RVMNPITGQPYEPQIVPRGDYTRVLAQFWADGPNSETPPGHWYAILNYVMDQPGFEKRFNGKGPILPDLEWDVKAYFALGGAVHDAAISAWGAKGWYDGVRPVSALRYMAGKGQSSDPELPSFDPAGITLRPGLIELIEPGDPLAGFANFNVGKIKLYTWRGPQTITDPTTETAGVGWILADNWWPFQRKTFVTPPFPGYISGHSTYSRAAAEVLTLVTGSEYFPGGLGEFHVAANSNFLGLEKGPSVDVTLQWATYRDASDQTSLSRIWGGIHPPMDDIPGRLIGMEVGQDAFYHAREIYYPDADNDGYYSYEDCDDHNPLLNPGALEICDGLDNNCDGLVDDLTTYSYYVDQDGDGFGDAAATSLDTCLTTAPAGFVDNNSDCNDNNPQLNPAAAEICDGLDNDCNGLVDDLPVLAYFRDFDGDGFGDASFELDTCLTTAPGGYVDNNQDCDDSDPELNPQASEVCDGLDNNCNGIADENLATFTYYADADGDSFGNEAVTLSSCELNAPAGYTVTGLDCDDNNVFVYPGAPELIDNLDNDCDGLIDETIDTNEPDNALFRVYPNPFGDVLNIENLAPGGEFILSVFAGDGILVEASKWNGGAAVQTLDFSGHASGLYFIQLLDIASGRKAVMKVAHLR
ncbi:MAG TPA: MopE-related protein, partial [Saprospiraceae bacterium]|nr:MopE-related protein [Saprospiraceae bacterium]